MNRWHTLSQLFLARLREFYREPVALFWTYGFPVLLAVGLGLAFSSGKAELPAVDVQELPQAYEGQALVAHLKEQGLPAELHTEDDCRKRLREGKTTLIVVPEPGKYLYVYDESRAESAAARYQVDDLVQRWKAGKAALPTEDVRIREPGNRYIDFFLPGLMGLNIMGGGLWGVGFVLVDMRTRKVIKRLVATPMRRSDFLLSILTARLMFMLPEMLLLVLLGRWGFGMPVRCDPLTLLAVILVGAFAFSGIGLLVACRAQTHETVSGLMNLVMLPMWILSGTFFSAKRFPETMQPFVQALPLTQLNDALRATILEGAALHEVALPLAILVVYAVVTFVLALKWFRWQ